MKRDLRGRDEKFAHSIGDLQKMAQDLYTAVDTYLTQTLIPADPILDAVLKSHADSGLPPINVTPTQGKFLNLQARMLNAKRILEIGTLGGYSTIWLARALPPAGKLVTLEYDPKHAEVARKNFQQAGLEKIIELHVGAALDTLPQIVATNPAPFDLIFVDADKKNNPHYFQWALKLSHAGTVIIIDNVIREGKILDAQNTDPDIQGIRKVLQDLGNEPRVSATVLQTTDAKGHDGLALALVL
jgi:predicted O-methyltransferase YrrM